VKGNTVEIDVPLSAMGSPAAGSVLYGLTGFTADTSAAVTTAGISGGTAPDAANGSAAFLDNIDQTAPIDVAVEQPSVNVPETPAPALLAAILGGGLLATGALRRRRHGGGAATKG